MSMTMDNKTARPSQGAEEVPRAADVELATIEEATAPRRRGGRSIRSRLGLLAARLLLGAALVGLWQLVVEAEIWDPTVTSNPSDVASYLWDAVGSSTLWSNLGVTMQAVVLAFLLASAVGIVVGISLALLPKLERVVSPYLDAVNAMPRIALAPIFVVGFGLTMNAKIALAFSIVVFMVMTAARAGVRSVDVDIMQLATVYGANRRQMFTKVLFPVAVPSIFGGLRLAVVYSLLGVVTSELIASRNGMGQLIQQYASLFQTDRVYGLLVVLAVVASILNAVMARLERHLLRWQPPAQN
jgi:NitT/TauT family transport system permease protein